MAVFSSPRFLRQVLLADAALGAASALLHLLAAGALAPLLGLPQGLIVGSGVALVAYVALSSYLAACDPVPRNPVWLLIAGNWAWAVACLALLAGGAAGTVWGQGWLAMQAAAVVALAELEWFALKRSPVRGWA